MHQSEINDRQRDIVKSALAAMTRSSVDFAAHPVFIDVRSSSAFSHWDVDKVPTLTLSRASPSGIYVHPRGSTLELNEMASLMGMPSNIADKMLTSGVAPSVIAKAIANAQSINVLERVLGARVIPCRAIVKGCFRIRIEVDFALRVPPRFLDVILLGFVIPMFLNGGLLGNNSLFS
jgi:hypothetical protein